MADYQINLVLEDKRKGRLTLTLEVENVSNIEEAYTQVLNTPLAILLGQLSIPKRTIVQTSVE